MVDLVSKADMPRLIVINKMDAENVSIQELIKNILAVTLQVRDVFGTAKREFTSQSTNLYNYNYFDMRTPILVLNLRYTFNNYKPKREGRGEDNPGFEGGEDFYEEG